MSQQQKDDAESGLTPEQLAARRVGTLMGVIEAGAEQLPYARVHIVGEIYLAPSWPKAFVQWCRTLAPGTMISYKVVPGPSVPKKDHESMYGSAAQDWKIEGVARELLN